MEFLDFMVDAPLRFHWAGKFEAPGADWMHMSRSLTDFEWIVMTKGELYIAAGEQKYTVHEGESLLLYPPCRQYGYRPSDCAYYWTHFAYAASFFEPVQSRETPALPSGSEPRILLPVQTGVPRMDRLIVLLKQLQNCDLTYHNESLDNYTLTTALCELYSQLYLSEGKKAQKGENRQLYTDMIGYIDWRVRETIRVSEIAAYFGYNEKYITTLFKRINGTTLKKYIMNRKMELAKAMLSDSDLSIAQIGYEIGFSDNHNFSNAFKRVTGQSPTEYRNTYAERSLYHQ